MSTSDKRWESSAQPQPILVGLKFVARKPRFGATTRRGGFHGP
jgi:hypothetical protein